MADDHKPGPDTSYTPEIGARICELLAEEGKSMRAICRMPGSPKRSTVVHWLNTIPEFKKAHDEARKIQEFFMKDDFHDEIESMNDGNYKWKSEQLKHKEWLAACIQPDVFSQKARLEHSGPDGGKIPISLEIDL